jgi:hypothetical protein
MDKRITMKNKIAYVLILFCCDSLSLLAQDGTGFDDDVIDNPPKAPIDNWLPLLVLAAIIFSFLVLKNRQINKEQL